MKAKTPTAIPIIVDFESLLELCTKVTYPDGGGIVVWITEGWDDVWITTVGYGWIIGLTTCLVVTTGVWVFVTIVFRTVGGGWVTLVVVVVTFLVGGDYERRPSTNGMKSSTTRHTIKRIVKYLRTLNFIYLYLLIIKY